MNDDLLAALVAQPLTPFAGRDVISSAIEVPSAAGGLREAMKFAPVEFDIDEEVYVLLRCTVKKVRYQKIKDTEALSRIHIFASDEATFVDGTFAETHLTAQRDKLRRLREEAQGISQLPDADERGEKPDGVTDEEWEASATR